MLKADSSTLKKPSARPEEPDAADDRELGRLFLDLGDDVEEPVDRALREGALELLDQVARLALLARRGATSERERKSSGTKESSAK